MRYILILILFCSCNSGYKEEIKLLNENLIVTKSLLEESQAATDACINDKIVQRDSLLKRITARTKIITAGPEPLFVAYDSTSKLLNHYIKLK